MHTTNRTRREAALTFISSRLLPLGYFVLLIGLSLLPDRNSYHKSFYLLVAIPTLTALALSPAALIKLAKEPVIIALMAFSAWALVSLNWSDTDSSTTSLLKRPIYIFMLFACCALIAQQSIKRLELTILLAAISMLAVSAYSLILFANTWTPESRLIGPGALDNPLLSSHLFGFFLTIWLGLAMTLPNKKLWLIVAPIVIATTTLLATGSRTPIVAICLASCWLALCKWNKRSLILISGGVLGLLTLLIIYPESLLNRGSSYRLELWLAALEKASHALWLGFGFDAHLAIKLDDIPYSFSEPHSFAIGVLYYTGIIGLSFWLMMHAVALLHCWKQRDNALFAIAGALLIYGLGAGLTEGGGILMRPKEHWFLTWIPLALIAALNINSRNATETKNDRLI
ncbi:O-antigen ligase family protein [Pseudomonas sp.]|uniref:O-antigen ligase family protein n=1 Tax=Pseudomonas sp. TaxID=306 RepID=UPI003BB5936C